MIADGSTIMPRPEGMIRAHMDTHCNNEENNSAKLQLEQNNCKTLQRTDLKKKSISLRMASKEWFFSVTEEDLEQIKIDSRAEGTVKTTKYWSYLKSTSVKNR